MLSPFSQRNAKIPPSLLLRLTRRYVNEMKKLIALSILLSSSPLLYAEDCEGCWVPVVEFKLGDSDYRETLIWVSGNSYAYSSVAQEMADAKVYCANSVGSQELLEILNYKHKGQKISSEQASATIKNVLPVRFPCQ